MMGCRDYSVQGRCIYHTVIWYLQAKHCIRKGHTHERHNIDGIGKGNPTGFFLFFFFFFLFFYYYAFAIKYVLAPWYWMFFFSLYLSPLSRCFSFFFFMSPNKMRVTLLVRRETIGLVQTNDTCGESVRD
ncbi:hypothetical protein V8C42DRAFT_56733 [Trichoderma barbatum]